MTFRDLNLRPNDRELRTFATLWLIGFGVFGLLIAWRSGAFASGVALGWQAPWRMPMVMWIVAIVGSVVGLARPAALRPVYVAWMVAVFPIGWTINQVLLLLTFYGLFTVVSVIFRLIGRDTMLRTFDKSAASYWIVRRPAPEVDQYFRQS